MNLHDPTQTAPLVAGCRKKDKRAQHELFRVSYSYAMSVCLRFSANADEAKEVLNDGFLKVFTQLDKYDPALSFAAWLRKVMVNTAIDHYRKHQRQTPHLDISKAEEAALPADALADLEAEDLLKLVQQLPQAYRMVFILHAVEGYTHEEIAARLGINEGTSKSNLAKARYKLQKQLVQLSNLQKKHG